MAETSSESAVGLGPGAGPETATPAAGQPLGSPLAAEMTSISKSFYGTKAIDDVDFDLRWGEVHALLGENGAGKTSLCSVLAGLYRPDDGEITVDGETVSFGSPRDALAAGVGMVYQEFRLVDSFTVAENVALGDPTAAVRLRRRRLERKVADLRGELRDRRPSRRPRRPPLGRRAPAGGDPQAPAPGRAHPHPRRTDGGPDAAGGRRSPPYVAADGRARGGRS